MGDGVVYHKLTIWVVPWRTLVILQSAIPPSIRLSCLVLHMDVVSFGFTSSSFSCLMVTVLVPILGLWSPGVVGPSGRSSSELSWPTGLNRKVGWGMSYSAVDCSVINFLGTVYPRPLYRSFMHSSANSLLRASANWPRHY